jgi:hypothetical protein
MAATRPALGCEHAAWTPGSPCGWKPSTRQTPPDSPLADRPERRRGEPEARGLRNPPPNADRTPTPAGSKLHLTAYVGARMISNELLH